MQVETLDALTRLGASINDFASFDFKAQQTCVQYGNLIRVQSQEAADDTPRIDSIFLGAAGALAYIVEFRQRNATRESRSRVLADIHKKLMTCGDAAMMVVVDRGWVQVFPLQQRYSPDSGTVIDLHVGNALFFRSMAMGCLPDILIGRPEWIEPKLDMVDELTRLITNAVYRLGRTIDQSLAYIVTVKAVLIRLLIERGLCSDETEAVIDVKQPFSTWEMAVAALTLLDDVLGFHALSVGQSRLADAIRDSYMSTAGGGSAVNPLASIFNEPVSTDGKSLEWGNFDLGYAQLAQIAEAFERAHSILFMQPGTRKVKPAVSTDLSILMASEAIKHLGGDFPRVLISTPGCGQLPVRALTQLVITHCNQSNVTWPSLEEVESIASNNIRCINTNPILEYISAAMIRITAFDLSSETYPVRLNSKSKLHPKLLFVSNENAKSDVVIGDYSEYGAHGRSAIATCQRNCLPNGTLAVAMSNDLVLADFCRIPPILRDGIQLTAVLTGIKVPRSDSYATVIIAKNKAPLNVQEFWFSVPYKPNHVVGVGHNWVDAANTMPVNQLLLSSLPELPSVLSRLTVPESSVLIRVWRTLSDSPTDFELIDASLTRYCHSLIRKSVVGQFMLKALTGDLTSSRKLPIERLKVLTASVRALASRVMESGAELVHPEAVVLVETLCAVDRTDIAIMERFLAGQGCVQISTSDFASQLHRRLVPFFNQKTFFVMDRTLSDQAPFAIFVLANQWKNDYEGIDFMAISQAIVNNPVSSREYVPLDDGRLILLIGIERLNAQELDVVVIEILRNFAGALEEDAQWLGD
jgi:hypothetical protein